jgi:hypothetical protein
VKLSKVAAQAIVVGERLVQGHAADGNRLSLAIQQARCDLE